MRGAGSEIALAPKEAANSAAEPVLAVGADVEQVHLEPDGDGDAGDVVRHDAWLMMTTTDSVESIAFHIAVNASIGLSPAISRAIDDTTIATAAAISGASTFGPTARQDPFGGGQRTVPCSVGTPHPVM